MVAPTSIILDDALKGRVQHLAEVRRRSSHWIMREAIAQYVEREEKREAFRQDAIRVWDEYQQTGLHLTLEEADAWLAKLEAGEDASQCQGAMQQRSEEHTSELQSLMRTSYAVFCSKQNNDLTLDLIP